jgi:SAUR family protein
LLTQKCPSFFILFFSSLFPVLTYIRTPSSTIQRRARTRDFSLSQPTLSTPIFQYYYIHPFFFFLFQKMSNMQEDKKSKVKKGWLAVRVGLEDEDCGFQRFVIPISYLYHPLFKRLLEKAHEVYGYHTTGPLRVPCSVDDFLHLRWRIEKESSHHSHHSHHHHHLPSSLSFYSCWSYVETKLPHIASFFIFITEAKFHVLHS